jgi:hypothetical protein
MATEILYLRIESGSQLSSRPSAAIQRNPVHGSDAPDTAHFDLGYFFSEVELV